MRTYHVTIALDTLLAMPDKELRGMLTLAGESLSPDQVRVTAEHFQRQGYTFLPTCDRVDAAGRCLGHAQDESSEVAAGDATDASTNH